MNTEEILCQIEEHMADLEEFDGASFETLENYFVLADSRLSVFAVGDMWAITIEAVRYEPGAGDNTLTIWVYGNCLNPVEYREQFSRSLFRAPNGWNEPSIDHNQFPRKGFAIRWRGQRYDFVVSDESLAAAGILLSREEAQSGMLTPPQMLRWVCHELDHPFFASEDTLRDLLANYRRDFNSRSDGGNTIYETPWGEQDEYPLPSTDLKLVLQTREWCHPRFTPSEGNWPGTQKGTLPAEPISIREAFEPLAQLLSTGDVNAWHAQDKTQFNSHWSHWAETAHTAELVRDEERHNLMEEGRQFREALRSLPLKEQQEILNNTKQKWEETQQGIQDFMNSLVFAVPIAHIEVPPFEWNGRTYRLGPHLWEEDTEA